MTVPTVGELFAGIGGFSLGFRRAGFRVAWQCEIDPFCQRVLEKNFLDAVRHDDVRTFPPGDPERWRVDVVCGGFPCTNVSRANAPHGGMSGLDGEQSGLWSEFARVVRLLRPGWVVVENVPDLLDGWMGRVLGDLAACGLDATWSVLPASAVGAPSRRERVFVVAHPDGKRLEGFHGQGEPAGHSRGVPRGVGRDYWMDRLPRPRVLRGGHGLPDLVDRVAACGNAVDPRVSEWIARRILTLMESHPC